MKTITVPQTVQILASVFDQETKVAKEVLTDYEFKSFVEFVLIVDPKFGENMKTIMSAVRIRDSFKVASPGDNVVLSDEDYALLRNVVEEPTNKYNPTVIIQLVSYLTAVVEAK